MVAVREHLPWVNVPQNKILPLLAKRGEGHHLNSINGEICRHVSAGGEIVNATTPAPRDAGHENAA